MIYFTLPDAAVRYDINNFMFQLNKMHPNFFKTKVSFYATKCIFPYLSWTGGVVSNTGNGMYFNDIIQFQETQVLPMHLNMSNVLLEDFDYDDCFGQTILTNCNNGSNVIEISSIPFMEKIAKDYPHYRFNLSAQADLITEFTPELLNCITDENKFLYIGLPAKFNYNKEFLSQLKSKKTYEITVNPPCLCDCADVCTLKLHQNQIDYVRHSHVNSCSKINRNTMISIEEIKKDFLPMGFNHFTFSSNVQVSNDDTFYFYLQYFIAEEFHSTVEQYWRQRRIV